MHATMRRRNVDDDKDEPAEVLTFSDRVRKHALQLDMFRKIDLDDTDGAVAVQTGAGGLVSLATALLIALLVFSSLQSYLTVRTSEHLIVDNTVQQRLPINFNITFPKLNCDQVRLDAMSVTGEQQMDMFKDIYHWRLAAGDDAGAGAGGAPIGQPYADDIAMHPHAAPHLADQREALRLILERAGIKINFGPGGRKRAIAPPPPKDERPEEMRPKEGEGCMLFGHFSVNKVAGNFHVAIGESAINPQGAHIHRFTRTGTKHFDVSHKINHLSFGKRFPGSYYPLDGATNNFDNQPTNMQYYLQIVPTRVLNERREALLTNQFSVTETKTELSFDGVRNVGKIPGLFFMYAFSPFMVEVTNTRDAFSHFLVKVCAIVGGVFAVAGIVDSLLFHSSRLMRRRPNGVVPSK
jgi:hypothetical protein